MGTLLKKLNHQPVMMTILVSLLLLALFLFLNHTPLWHTDVWAHLRFGSWISDHQRFPEREPFNPWSDDSPYVPFAWLSQVIMWKVYEAGAWLPYRWSWDEASQPGGVDFLRLLHALLVTLRFVFLYWAFVRLSGSRLISLSGIVFSMMLCWTTLEVLRPQVWGELCLCIVLFLGCRQPPSRLAVWLTPLIMVLWANLHGSYLNGLLILLGLWASRLFQAIRSCAQSQRIDAFHSAAFRRSLRMLLLSILAVGVLNPLYSFRWFHETLAFAGNPNVRCMDEWQRLQWDTPLGILFMVSLVVVLATQWLATWRKVPGINMGHGLLLVCFGVQVVFFQRMFPWWAIICPFVCIGPWTRILGCPPGDGLVSWKHRLMQWVALLGCLWIGFAWSNLGKVLLHEDITLLDQSLHPATPRLVDRAHDQKVRPGVDPELFEAVHQPGSSIFCSETLGDYLLFAKCRPVVIYSHVQLFSPQHWHECMVVKEGIATWEKYLNKWNSQVVCVEAELHPRLCAAVKESPNWRVLLDETHSSSKPNPKSRLFIAIRKQHPMSTSALPWFQSLFAERIGGMKYGQGTAIYKFEKIKRAKREALAQFPNRTLLDFGIGENDDMADASIRQVLCDEANKVENRGYADNGILAFKEAAARFMKREFNVTLDPATEINHAIGSKPAYAMLPAAFINPGDVTLMTVPGYPVAGTHTKYYGGEVYPLPLLPQNNFFPDLKSIPTDIAKRAKLLVINYPNSPTGQVATKEFYREVIDFAHRHQVVIVQDAAHILLSYQGRPMSFLEMDGAREVGVEVHSMSKGFNMIGWRMGFVAGHERIVRAFADIKDNCDSGQFMAVQKAAAFALDQPAIHQAVRKKYQRRLEKLVAALNSVGFTAKMPGGTYFLYVKAPKGCNHRAFVDAEDVSQFLITNLSLCCVPWDDAGPHLRFSVTYSAPDESAEDALMTETVKRLKSLELEF